METRSFYEGEAFLAPGPEAKVGNWTQVCHCSTFLKEKPEPWPVWLSGLSTGLRTKGRWFDSLSGHMPGLPARSPVGGT